MDEMTEDTKKKLIFHIENFVEYLHKENFHHEHILIALISGLASYSQELGVPHCMIKKLMEQWLLAYKINSNAK